MNEQLQLTEPEAKTYPWKMTDWYRRVGRKGVRQARLVLSKSDPKPHEHSWKITHATKYGTLALRCRLCPMTAVARVSLTGEAGKPITNLRYPLDIETDAGVLHIDAVGRATVSAALTESRGLVQGSAADLPDNTTFDNVPGVTHARAR